jgi:uncharacterized membrane protein YgcG
MTVYQARYISNPTFGEYLQPTKIHDAAATPIKSKQYLLLYRSNSNTVQRPNHLLYYNLSFFAQLRSLSTLLQRNNHILFVKNKDIRFLVTYSGIYLSGSSNSGGGGSGEDHGGSSDSGGGGGHGSGDSGGGGEIFELLKISRHYVV